MNHPTKLVLVVGIVLLIWAVAFAMTAGASSGDRSTTLARPQVFALQGPPITYTLSVNVTPSGGGSVTKNPNLPVYISGTVVSLTAVPAAGYKFDNWSGDASGTSPSTSVTMNANKNVTANFSALPMYNLTVNIVGTGTVAKNPDLSSYPQGSNVQLTATPGSGWRFGGWSGGGLSGSTSPINVPMDATKVITATFIRQVSLTVNVAGNGTVTKNPNQATYDLNSSVQLTANPATGWQFTGWSGGGLSGATNPVTLVMDGDKTVTANFAATPTCYTLTTAMNPSGVGVVTINTASNCGGGNKYTSETSVNLTATANGGSGYTFSSWTGCTSSSGASCSVTMNANKTVTANFTTGSSCYTLTVVVSPSGAGSVSANPAPNCINGTQYLSGASVALTAKANSGYVFSSWSGDTSGSANPATVTMNGTKNVTANFAVVSPSPLATITPLLGGVVATVTVAPTPSSALPSTGASPLIWIAMGLVLVLIAIGARYLRQSST